MKECPNCRHCYDDDQINCSIDDGVLVSSIPMNLVINDRYTLEKRLGKGGMGIVFKAKHKFLRTSHAIKIILPSLFDEDYDDSLLVRFKQEAVLSASIDHPNIIRVTDFGVENGTMPYLVMEFIDGSPLSDYLIKHNRFTTEQAIGYFRPIAVAVAEAHKQGIVHRDLKPQNIMVQRDLPLTSAIKVLDFGLAKIKSPDSFGSLVQAKTLSVIGSPPYMSPEQWENSGVDYRTDIYALGVIFYQLLAGKVPFDGESVPQIMFQHMSATPPAFESLGVEVSKYIAAVVFKALEKDVSLRYQSVEELLVALGNATREPQQESDLNTIASASNLPISNFTKENDSKTTIAEGNNLRPTEPAFKVNVSTGSDPAIQPDQYLSQETISAKNAKEPDKQASGITNANQEETSKSHLPKILVGVSGLFLIFFVAASALVYFFLFKSDTPTQVNRNSPTEPTQLSNKPTEPSQNKDIERVLIKGGEFKMGNNEVPPNDPIWGIQYPAHTVEVNSFFLDKTEVSNKDYAEFVAETKRNPPSNWVNGSPAAETENQPVTFVSLEDAKAFAQWVSKKENKQCRLPTEQEWEFAARNASMETLYPWGNEWNADSSNIGSGKPVDVGTSKDETLDGSVNDLLGNVIEWTSSAESLYPGHPDQLNSTSETLYVIRGSSWGETKNNMKKSEWLSTRRQFVQMEQKSPYLGFRLACDP